MNDYFEVYGTPIKIASIKEFRIVQKEYIYRPTYKATEKKRFGFSSKRYEFFAMQPYAAILDERGHTTAVSEYKAKDFKESVGKDIIEGAVSALGDRLNIKALKYKKYVCTNTAGRVFSTYLEDVPALIMSEDGKVSDVYKNDELYPQLGEPIAPAINIVPALFIVTKENKYIFYGNGIQLQDVVCDYERLKAAITEYQSRGILDKSKKVALPQINLPKISIKKNKDLLQIDEKMEVDID